MTTPTMGYPVDILHLGLSVWSSVQNLNVPALWGTEIINEV